MCTLCCRALQLALSPKLLYGSALSTSAALMAVSVKTIMKSKRSIQIQSVNLDLNRSLKKVAGCRIYNITYSTQQLQPPAPTSQNLLSCHDSLVIDWAKGSHT